MRFHRFEILLVIWSSSLSQVLIEYLDMEFIWLTYIWAKNLVKLKVIVNEAETYFGILLLYSIILFFNIPKFKTVLNLQWFWIYLKNITMNRVQMFNWVSIQINADVAAGLISRGFLSEGMNTNLCCFGHN